ncbi:hypothetical protein [Pleomorphovibrio marinus]|uniref:hypothetical protein n=1 Tax=Pleomorphovibrio marinus TaxID=2164132 RepID=UPI000E0B1E22|nr:hypothetical protein [Pleomorphovibrio marinus]
MKALDKKDLEPERIKLENSITLYKRLAWVAIGVACLSILFLIGINFFVASDYLTLNETGTYIGGVAGALFGLAGVFLVYIAFLGQRLQMLFQQQELRDNRKELKLNRKELKGQKKEMARLNQLNISTLNNQYFFKLLETFRTGVEELIYLINSNGGTSSLSGFEKIHDLLVSRVMPEGYEGGDEKLNVRSPLIEEIKREFIFLKLDYRSLEKFNQLLKVILEFIEKNDLDKYNVIIEASMTFHEKSISFFFLVFDQEFNRKYLSKIGFLKSVDKDSLINAEIYKMLYPQG